MTSARGPRARATRHYSRAAGGAVRSEPGAASTSPDVARNAGFDGEYLTVYAPLLTCSPKMRAVKEIVEEVARINTTVLIRGESGVGKYVVARAIHAASARHDGPFVQVNCAALPAELLESELFGHEKGAFTGAYRRRLGTLEFAHRGTILLDEIGELSLSLQPKLLHVLQDMRFCRIGGREPINVDVRVVASTNRDLELALTKGQWREDLYYRLNVVEIRVPPLRERVEEIPALAAYLLAKYNEQYKRSVDLPQETIELFQRCLWPGNVRQLENIIRRLVVLGDYREVHEELLRHDALAQRWPQPPASAAGSSGSASAELGAPLGLREIARRAALEAERKALMEVLDRVRWNRVAAARMLQISYKTLLKKIAECKLANGTSRRDPSGGQAVPGSPPAQSQS